MKVIGTGLSGLVGSRVVELLSSKITFENYSLDTGVDITKKDVIEEKLVSDPLASWVLHMAAYTDVQGAEKERELGEKSKAYQVNVLATDHIAHVCKQTGKHMLYIDTDYAFDGTKQLYTEEDTPHPLGWYANTKSLGAKAVHALGNLGLVIRISNPYRAHPVGKKDFAHKILERLYAGQEVIAPTDQLFVPTFIDDIAAAIDVLVSQNASGIYHVTSPAGISPYDAAMAIGMTYGCSLSLIKKTTFKEYFAGRAPTPQYAVLSNKKIEALGVHMHDFHEGIGLVHAQESSR